MNRSDGFTLIELVAAIAIFAIVAVIAQQSVVAAMSQQARLSQASTDLAELELAVSLVTRDLQNIAPRPARTGPGRPDPALRLTGGDRLALTRSGMGDPAGQGRGPFLRVAYAPPEGDSTSPQRSTWDRLDRPASARSRQAALWSGIRSVAFRVYAEGQWRDDWPPGDDPSELPQGIAVTFDTDRWGVIERVVALQ